METPAPKNLLEPGKSYHGLMSLFVAAAAIAFILLAASINSYTTQMLEEIKGLRQDISDLRDRDLVAKKNAMGLGEKMMAKGETIHVDDGNLGFSIELPTGFTLVEESKKGLVRTWAITPPDGKATVFLTDGKSEPSWHGREFKAGLVQYWLYTEGLIPEYFESVADSFEFGQ